MVAKPYKKASGPGSKPQHANHKPQKPTHKLAHKHRSNKGRKLEARLANKEM